MRAFLLSFLGCGDHSGWKPRFSIWGLWFRGESNPGLLSHSSWLWTFPSDPSKENRQKSDFSNCFIQFCTKNFTKKLKNSMQTPNGGNHMTRTVRKRSVVRGKTKVNTLLFQFHRRRSSPSGAGGLKLSVTFSRANSHIDL